jgi:hypothetical protein
LIGDARPDDPASDDHYVCVLAQLISLSRVNERGLIPCLQYSQNTRREFDHPLLVVALAFILAAR